MGSIEVPPLADYLAQIPDFRHARGKRHPLPAVLLLSCVAMLSGATSETAIADWAAHHGPVWRQRLGLPHATGPSQPTLSRIFKGIDRLQLEDQLSRWAAQVLGHLPALAGASPASLEGVSLDGKTLRGSAKRGAVDAHLLSAFSHRLGVVLRQVAVTDHSNEVPAADELVAQLVLTGTVVTTDALLTQARLAQTILDRGGHYLMVVKDNHPTLLEDLTTLFADPTAPVQRVTDLTLQRGRVEERRLMASTELVGYSDWPGLQQALCLDRTVTLKATGRVRRERAYAVTSIPAPCLLAAGLLALWRGHWSIENKSHYVRDVTLGEDRSSVRAGHIPQVMAALRNAVIGLLRLLGEANIAAACRRFAAQPDHALAALTLPVRL